MPVDNTSSTNNSNNNQNNSLPRPRILTTIPTHLQQNETQIDAIIQQYSEAVEMNYPRRRQMEDAHCFKDPLYKYTGKDGKEHTVAMYALFDGYCGRYAALKAASIVADLCEVELKEYEFDTSDVMKLQKETKILKYENLIETNDERKRELNQQLMMKYNEFERENHQLNELFTRVMTEVFNNMDRIIIESKVDESGCCALVCIIDDCEGEKVVCMANVGDSTGNIIVQNSSGMYDGVIEMSVEHRPHKWNQEERERIENLGGLIFNDRVNGISPVSRSIGDSILKPYVSNEPFCRIEVCDKERHKFVILGSDGLWDYITPTTIPNYLQNYLSEGIPINEYGNKLILQSKRNGSPDNITVFVLQLNDLILPQL